MYGQLSCLVTFLAFNIFYVPSALGNSGIDTTGKVHVLDWSPPTSVSSVPVLTITAGDSLFLSSTHPPNEIISVGSLDALVHCDTSLYPTNHLPHTSSPDGGKLYHFDVPGTFNMTSSDPTSCREGLRFQVNVGEARRPIDLRNRQPMLVTPVGSALPQWKIFGRYWDMRIHVGDYLLFFYDNYNDVSIVDGLEAYENCDVTKMTRIGAPEDGSTDFRGLAIPFEYPGVYYISDSVGSHCACGMKFRVIVTEDERMSRGIFTSGGKRQAGTWMAMVVVTFCLLFMG